jgi:uncharacterized FlaG/YvyC family protein
MLNAKQQDRMKKEQILLDMIESLEYLLKMIRGEIEFTHNTSIETLNYE